MTGGEQGAEIGHFVGGIAEGIMDRRRGDVEDRPGDGVEIER